MTIMREELLRSTNSHGEYRTGTGSGRQHNQPKRNGKDARLTQDSAAVAFAEKYRDTLRFDHDAKAWYVYEAGRWRLEKKQLAFHWARTLIREIADQCAKPPPPKVSEATFASSVERFCRATPALAVTSEAWDPNPFLLGTPTGTVDLRTGRIRPSDPADMITMRTAVDPADTPDCERFLHFLYDIMGNDAELVAFLQRFWGYALTGDTSEEALAFGYGTGANGKGVSLNTIAAVMGDYAIPATMDTFTASRTERHPTELARLRGKRLVTASETEEGKSWDESRIKRLTGRDPIPARFLHKDFFEYLPAFKLFITGNHKPKLKTMDEAIRRRFLIIPFAVTIPKEKRDKHFAEKLRPEWPGILRWLIEGCLEWQRIGLQPPTSVIEATQSYFDAQDLLGQWLDEKCVCERNNHTLYQLVTALYASWKEYAEAHGEYVGGSKQFSDALEQRGFTRRKTTINGVNGRFFSGIELRS